jgi:hypothetical protein
MVSAQSNIPWDELGSLEAKNLISSSEQMTEITRNGLAGRTDPGIPDFYDHRWKYELCILTMFWLWYVANSPKLKNLGATRPLLDAYHRGCCEAMIQAGLIKNSEPGIRGWENDLEDRFLAYENAYVMEQAARENPEHFPGRVYQRGSVGWLFSQYVLPRQQPSYLLLVLLKDFGSSRFIELVKMIEDLETRYDHPKS